MAVPVDANDSTSSSSHSHTAGIVVVILVSIIVLVVILFIVLNKDRRYVSVIHLKIMNCCLGFVVQIFLF